MLNIRLPCCKGHLAVEDGARCPSYIPNHANQAGRAATAAHIAISAEARTLNATAALEYLCAPAYRASLRPTRILADESDRTRP